ncbi:OmpA family protein [Lentisphaera profundi]|uniref:OmpA family protein n=1 Tax=Lentisphaera profundi TaxID=1658616 RepID=A0ABY7VWZ1_9BACT|nr:OmpA family protein [Lentisphaera profundi]WDE98431.1 OmpA family protein [Lentisphaera profundi]
MKSTLWILVIVVVTLLGTGAWLLWENDQLKQNKVHLQSEIKQLLDQQSGLEAHLDTKEQEKSALNSALQQEKTYQEELLAQHQLQLDEFKQSVEDEKEETSTLHSKLVEELQNEITNREIKLQELNGRISLSMENKILFPSGTANLGDRGAEVLNKISDALSETEDHIIRVEGHTDNIPLSGKGLYKNNWELSAARALSVVKELLKTKKLNEQDLEAVAMGEFHPVAENSNKEGRAQNRRIEIYLSPKVEKESLKESIQDELIID